MATAHAGCTAEGDNRVLMVKVCKDMITNITKKGHQLPQMTQCPFRQLGKSADVTSLRSLLDLFKFRETVLFTRLIEKNKNLEKTLGKYQVLMRETSDLMQNLSQCYGERHCLEFCIEQLGKLQNSENKNLLEKVFRLYGSDVIYRDLAFYMIEGVVSVEASKNLSATRLQLIKDIAPKCNDLFDCMSIPKHALYAPIANDYVKYNASPNYGEVIGAKM